MTRRGLSRLVGVATATLLVLAAGTFVWTAAASAHVVTGIEADCTHVTVHFADFPKSGVTVHIAATVEGHAPVTTDVLVDKHSGPAELNISGVTSDLFGATANVDVDVTWTFQGDQHVHQTLQVTCGETTSTASAASSSTESTGSTTSTTGAGGGSTSTTNSSESTSSTVANGASTSTSVAAGSSTSSSLGPVAGVVVRTTTSTGARQAASGTTEVAGESIASPTATGAIGPTGAGQTGSLPFTGVSTVPLFALGIAALTAGAATIAGVRRRRMTSS